ncbi:MAG: hypothetical protein ACRDIE_24655 [Chloroflexota bacterium]
MRVFDHDAESGGRSRMWRVFSVTCLMTAAMALVSPLRGMPARAAPAPAISAFFTVSPADAAPFYHAKNGAPVQPSNSRSFPHGVSAVYYYFAYSGAVPGATRFQVFLDDASGNTLTEDPADTADRVSGQLMNSFSNFPDGTYQMVLYVNDVPLKKTVFLVGQGLAVDAFDTIAKQQSAGFTKAGQSPPARTVTFNPGAAICFYVSYEAANPNISTITVTLYNSTGTAVLHQGGTLRYEDGYHVGCFEVSASIGIGVYYLGLQDGAGTIAITNLAVERSAAPPTGPKLTAFYTIAAGGFSSMPPKVARFSYGLKTILFAFAVRGVAPEKVAYTLDLRGPNGGGILPGLSVGGGFNIDESASSGWATGSISYTKPFPPGTYRLTMRSHGTTLAVTTFSIEKVAVVATNMYTFVAKGNPARPAPVSRFPYGTKSIPVYVAIHGTGIDLIDFDVTLEVPTGVHLDASFTNSRIVHYTAADGAEIFSAVASKPYPSGTYVILLKSQGRVLAFTSFTIVK